MKSRFVKKEFEHSDDTREKTILNFPVVGIGASAGGLEALQEFFKHMVAEPEAAFVIIQHLSPDYKSYMNELLSRFTTIEIEIVTHGTIIKSNHIYLIPPKMNMTIIHGKLYLEELSETRTLNLPIDIFFRSLARDQEKNSVGIILSGAGSDGSLGIKAIKEFGGMTMAQEEKSARFESMPHSSISTGMVDIIMPPGPLAEALFNYIKHPLVKENRKSESILGREQNQLSRIIGILLETKNVDFSCYKENTIVRRLEKRISLNRFDKIEDYVKFLNGNEKEIHILFNELLIGVTRFFRDEYAFSSLKKLVIARLLESSVLKREIRVWVTACSTGEEAYSIAILFKECMSELNIYREIKIFATDLDINSLEYAAQGFYPDNIITDVSPERLSKYFTRRENGYQINENIRGMIVFARQNIINDPPFSKLDLISCRNFLIYVNPEVQQSIITLFNMSLNEGGFMFLGSSESLGNMAEGFLITENKSKIFQKQPNYKPLLQGNMRPLPLNSNHQEVLHANQLMKISKGKYRFPEIIFDQIMGEYLPPSVLIDENFNVLHTINNINEYLSIPSGQISINLLKMLSRENAVYVSSLIRRAEKSNLKIVIENIDSKHEGKQLTLSCKKIVDNLGINSFYLISFHEKDVKQIPKKETKIRKTNINLHFTERIVDLEKELQMKSESLQATVEELETSNEELQSSNEELVASNEELQSTNEELQSVNEELYTVNSEHIRKIEELTEMTSDFENLLKNTQIGTLYLDKNLIIRKVNDVASKLTHVITSDVGRPLRHLSMSNFDNDLFSDIESVLNNLQVLEREVYDKAGNCYLMRIIPYRTLENAVEGIIVTFVNISTLKKVQTELITISGRLERALEMGDMSWWEWDYKRNEVTTGSAKYQMLGYTREEIGPGFEAWTRYIHPEDYPLAMKAMKDHLEGKVSSYFVEYRIRHKDGHYLWYRDKGGVVTRDEKGKPGLLVGIVMNITHER